METVNISALNPTISEGSFDIGIFRFSRTNPSSTPLTITYNLTGQALPGIDYQPNPSGSITIPAFTSSIDLRLFP